MKILTGGFHPKIFFSCNQLIVTFLTINVIEPQTERRTADRCTDAQTQAAADTLPENKGRYIACSLRTNKQTDAQKSLPYYLTKISFKTISA